MGSKNTGHKLVRRKFNLDKDYGILKKWWEKHGSDLPKPEFLSETGLVIEVNGEMTAAGFIYKTDSAFCIFEWFVVNPDSEKKHREMALDYLVESVVEWKEKAGFKVIYTSTKGKRMINRFKEKGFMAIDTGMTHLFEGVE